MAHVSRLRGNGNRKPPFFSQANANPACRSRCRLYGYFVLGEDMKIMADTEKDNLPAPLGGDFILYQTEDGHTRIEVQFSGQTVWLSLNQMAALFQRDKSVISKHIQNVFEERELAQEATVAKFATVQTEGGREVRRAIEFYNLDV